MHSKASFRIKDGVLAANEKILAEERADGRKRTQTNLILGVKTPDVDQTDSML